MVAWSNYHLLNVIKLSTIIWLFGNALCKFFSPRFIAYLNKKPEMNFTYNSLVYMCFRANFTCVVPVFVMGFDRGIGAAEEPSPIPRQLKTTTVSYPLQPE